MILCPYDLLSSWCYHTTRKIYVYSWWKSHIFVAHTRWPALLKDLPWLSHVAWFKQCYLVSANNLWKQRYMGFTSLHCLNHAVSRNGKPCLTKVPGFILTTLSPKKFAFCFGFCIRMKWKFSRPTEKFWDKYQVPRRTWTFPHKLESSQANFWLLSYTETLESFQMHFLIMVTTNRFVQ